MKRYAYEILAVFVFIVIVGLFALLAYAVNYQNRRANAMAGQTITLHNDVYVITGMGSGQTVHAVGPKGWAIVLSLDAAEKLLETKNPEK